MTSALYELGGVAVAYGARLALDGIDLTIAAGSRVALVGPSGAGKSTLLGVLNGTVRPTAGTVAYSGSPIDDSDAWRRGHGSSIATIHQDLHLVGSLRVVHNVNAGRLGRWGTARALGSLVRPQGVDSVRRALAQVGLEDRVHDRTDRLSGGQRQRVAIARVLVAEPRVVLADEPVSSLDPARADEVVALLCRVAAPADGALVVSLHAFDLALRHCDRIVGLRGGRVMFDAAPHDVTASMAEALYRLDDTIRDGAR